LPDSWDRLEAAKKIIIDWWREQQYLCDQQRWAYLFYEGLISDEEANAWAEEAWPEEVLEKEYEDESEA